MIIMKSFSNFLNNVKEDFGGAVSATNNVGSGQVAGLGVNNPNISNQGEPPGPAAVLNKRKRVYTRKPPINEGKTSDIHCKVFDVGAKAFYDCRMAKRKRPRLEDYVGDDDLGKAIKNFAKASPKSGIMMRNKLTKEIMNLRLPR